MKRNFLSLGAVCAALAYLLFATGALRAADSVCAQVQIRIEQKLALERTGFEASLQVSNGLSDQSLEHFTVNLVFSGTGALADVNATTNPSDSTATFWYKARIQKRCRQSVLCMANLQAT